MPALVVEPGTHFVVIVLSDSPLGERDSPVTGHDAWEAARRRIVCPFEAGPDSTRPGQGAQIGTSCEAPSFRLRRRLS